MTDLWVEATHDFEREDSDRSLVAAREQVADLWQFLASSVNQEDFENRKALIADRLDNAAQGETRQRLEAALDRDFEVVLSQRPKGRTAADKTAYDLFDFDDAVCRETIKKLQAVDGYDEGAVLEAIKGIGYRNFQVLDEKPGYFGNYYDADWHWKLRRARNSADGFFETLNITASKTADAKFEPNNPEFMAGFRAGSADARTQPTVNFPGRGMVDYGHSIPEGASDKFRKGYASGYQSATDVHMGTRRTAEKWRADVAGVNESEWSNNAMEYDTPEEAKAWLADLSMRWFGYDMARVVPVSTPKHEQIDPADPTIHQNFRSGSRHVQGSGNGRRTAGWDPFLDAEPQPPRTPASPDPEGPIVPCSRCGSNMKPSSGSPTRWAHVEGEKDHRAVRYAEGRKQAWTEDMSDVSYMAEKLMTLTGDAAEGVHAAPGSTGDAEMMLVEDRLVELIKPLAGDITDADQAILEDYNFHITNRAIDRVKGRKKFSTRKTAFSPTHQCFDTSSPTGFVPCELVEGDIRGPEGTFVTIRLADGSTRSELGEFVIPNEGRQGSRKTAYYSIEWSGGFGTDSGYSSEAEAVRTAIENGDPEAGIFYNEASGDSYLGKAQALADELDLEEFNFMARAQGSGSRGSARRHPFGRKTALAPVPTTTINIDGRDITVYASPSSTGQPRNRWIAIEILRSENVGHEWFGGADRDTVSRKVGRGPWRVIDTTQYEWTATPAWKMLGSKTAAQILDEDPENNTMTTAQGVWTMEYDSESMKRMKSADDYEPWYPEFPNEAEWSQPHHYKLTGPNGQTHEFSAQGDAVAGPWYSAWEQARHIVSQSSRKTAQAGPPEPWPESACGEQDEDTFCIRDTDHEGDHQFRSRFWIEQKMDDAGLTSIEEELPEEGEEQAEEVPEEAPAQPAEKAPEEKKGEVPPQFKKKTSRPKADTSKVAAFEIPDNCPKCDHPLNAHKVDTTQVEMHNDFAARISSDQPFTCDQCGCDLTLAEVTITQTHTSRKVAETGASDEESPRICQNCGYPLDEATPAADCNRHPAPREGMRKVTAFVLGEPEDWEDRVHYRMVARGIGRNTPHSQRTTHLLERAKQWATREGAEGWKAANDFVYGSYEILEVGVDAEPFLDANREYLKPRAGMLKGAPFADYKDFADCTSKNSDKDDPEAYCGYIKHKVEDTKESILIASALLPRLTNADFEQATEELGRERVSGRA